MELNASFREELDRILSIYVQYIVYILYRLPRTVELNASLCEELDRILSIYVQYIVCIYIQAAQDCGTQRLIP